MLHYVVKITQKKGFFIFFCNANLTTIIFEYLLANDFYIT